MPDLDPQRAAIPGTLTHAGRSPRLHPDVFIAPGACVIGDVEIGQGSSVWFNSVVRGDVFPIVIGQRVNIQDLTMVHVTGGRFATRIEDDVTIGHRVVLHGCTIEHHCLVGMGAVVMDDVTVGPWCIIGAGALVTPGTHIPEGTLAVGSPARVRRELTDAERLDLEASAVRYQRLAAQYRAEPWFGDGPAGLRR